MTMVWTKTTSQMTTASVTTRTKTSMRGYADDHEEDEIEHGEDGD
jgi:hypothetical protein